MLPAPKCTAFMVLIWGFGDLGIGRARRVSQGGVTKEWFDGTGTRQSVTRDAARLCPEVASFNAVKAD